MEIPLSLKKLVSSDVESSLNLNLTIIGNRQLKSKKTLAEDDLWVDFK